MKAVKVFDEDNDGGGEYVINTQETRLNNSTVILS